MATVNDKLAIELKAHRERNKRGRHIRTDKELQDHINKVNIGQNSKSAKAGTLAATKLTYNLTKDERLAILNARKKAGIVITGAQEVELGEPARIAALRRK